MHQVRTKDMHRLEQDLHARFADKCIAGEWFQLTAEDIEWIQGQ